MRAESQLSARANSFSVAAESPDPPAEIHKGIRAGFMPPKIPYGPLHRLFNEPIISRGLELAETRREFELALGKGAIAMLARRLTRSWLAELRLRNDERASVSNRKIFSRSSKTRLRRRLRRRLRGICGLFPSWAVGIPHRLCIMLRRESALNSANSRIDRGGQEVQQEDRRGVG